MSVVLWCDPRGGMVDRGWVAVVCGGAASAAACTHLMADTVTVVVTVGMCMRLHVPHGVVTGFFFFAFCGLIIIIDLTLPGRRQRSDKGKKKGGDQRRGRR